MDNDFKHVSSDPDFWDEKNAIFYNKYSGINECHNQWKMQVMNGKRIIGPSGREWRIEPKPGGDVPWTTLTNYPVQGTGADLMAIARVSLRNRLKNGNLQSQLINTIHDSLICDVPDKELDKCVKIMYNVFDTLEENMYKLWGIISPIPFPCEVKIGKNLGEMKKYEHN